MALIHTVPSIRGAGLTGLGGLGCKGNLASVLLSAAVITLYRVYNVPLLGTMPAA